MKPNATAAYDKRIKKWVALVTYFWDEKNAWQHNYLGGNGWETEAEALKISEDFVKTHHNAFAAIAHETTTPQKNITTRTELTPQGEQLLIAGCERIIPQTPSKATQMALWD
jgi:hypothetical protein